MKVSSVDDVAALWAVTAQCACQCGVSCDVPTSRESLQSRRLVSRSRGLAFSANSRLLLTPCFRTVIYDGEKTAFHAAASDTCRQASGKQTCLKRELRASLAHPSTRM